MFSPLLDNELFESGESEFMVLRKKKEKKEDKLRRRKQSWSHK